VSDTAATPSAPPSIASYLLTRLPSRITWKALAIATLGLGLLIPLGLIHTVVWERQGRFDDAVRAIAASWGPAQRLSGPVLAMGFEIPNERPDAKEAPRREVVLLMPEKQQIDAKLLVETRRRSLFEVNVYRAEIVLTGEFLLADMVARVGRNIPDWSTAEIRMGIANPRSVQIVEATLAGLPVAFDAGGTDPAFGSTVNALLAEPLDPKTRPRIPFRVKLLANGSHAFSFVPLGRETSAMVAANWDAPSFVGAQLPTSWKYQDDGFVASWQIGHLGRGVPQAVLESEGRATGLALRNNDVGVELVTAVSSYRLVERAIKYGVLFIGLTFAVFLLAERLSAHVLHVVQYGLVGLSLCLFFVLLLALAEHIGFAVAYLISAAAIVAQTGLYVRAAVRDWRPAVIHAAMVAGLYACLYALLQLEDRALLVGAAFLFIVLSALMYATRGLTHSGRPVDA